MKTAAVLSLAGLATAATVRIDVSPGKFTPSEAKAAVGDILEFHFMPGGHSVAMGAFDTPCMPATTGGFFSGYFTPSSGEADQVFRVQVNSTDPIWLYCTAPGHCAKGMVGSVNPTADKTFTQYHDASTAFTGQSVAPQAVFGGSLAANSAPSPTSAAPSGASSTPSPSTTVKPGAAANVRVTAAGVVTIVAGVAFSYFML